MQNLPWALVYEVNSDWKRDSASGTALTACIDLTLGEMIKQALDVLPSPRCGIGSKFYWLWETAFGNTGPP